MDDPAIMPPQPDNGKAWLIWCIATIVLPAIAGSLFIRGGVSNRVAMILGAVAFVLHLFASTKMDGTKGCAVLFFLIGGWALMVVTFFGGCALSFPNI